MTTFLEVKAERRQDAARRFMTGWRLITVAQMLALDANPVELAPAPGVGKLAMPIRILARGEGGAGYDMSNGNLSVRHADGEGQMLTGFETVGGNGAPFISHFIAAQVDNIIAGENSALVLATDNPGGGEITAGDYDIEVNLEYEIVEL